MPLIQVITTRLVPYVIMRQALLTAAMRSPAKVETTDTCSSCTAEFLLRYHLCPVCNAALVSLPVFRALTSAVLGGSSPGCSDSLNDRHLHYVSLPMQRGRCCRPPLIHTRGLPILSTYSYTRRLSLGRTPFSAPAVARTPLPPMLETNGCTATQSAYQPLPTTPFSPELIQFGSLWDWLRRLGATTALRHADH